jgi:hypothetical protein
VPRRSFQLVLIAVCVGGGLGVAPLGAAAADQEWHAGVRAGVASLAGQGVGPAIGVHGAYGLGDMFDVTAELLGSRHGGASGTDVLSASAGLAYKIDVLQWIPYVAVLGGYYHYGGAPGPDGERGSEVGASAQIGIDYLVMRQLAIGADVRWHASFHGGMDIPLVSATLGAEYRWGL